MIKRIRIKNYKSFKDATVNLGKMTVLMGPNAAGKSNLLDAISLLSHCVTSPDLNKAFEAHRGEPLESVHNNLFYINSNSISEKSTYGEITIEVDVELPDLIVERVNQKIKQMRQSYDKQKSITAENSGKAKVVEKCLRYSLSLRIDYKIGHIGVINEMACAMRKNWTAPKKGRNPFIEKTGNKLTLRREQQSHPMYYEIGLDYTLLSSSLYTPHYPHLTALKEEIGSWKFFYLEPRNLMRTIDPVKEVKTIGSRGENLAAFYNTLRASNDKQFNSIGMALSQIVPDIQAIDIRRITDRGEIELEIIETSGRRSSRIISEGTLRLLGIVAIMNSLEQLSVVGYEEPENGVHPRRVILLAAWFKNSAEQGDTQWILTTHSPLFAKQFSDEELLVSIKDGDGSKFQSFKSAGDLLRDQELRDSLEERLARGDYDR